MKIPPSEQETVEISARDIYKERYDDGDISFEEFLILTASRCYYCGQKPKTRYHTSLTLAGKFRNKRSKLHAKNKDAYFVYNGLDRLDSNGKHDKKNVVPCCPTCNFIKGDFSKEIFLKKVCEIAEFWKLKGVMRDLEKER